MQNTVTQNNIRKKIYLWTFVFSTIISSSTSVYIIKYFKSLMKDFNAKGFDFVLSNFTLTLIFFYLITWIIDNWLWKYPGFNKLFKIEDLSGSWKGFLIELKEGVPEKTAVKLDIIQTLDSMDILMEVEGIFEIDVYSVAIKKSPKIHTIYFNFAYRYDVTKGNKQFDGSCKLVFKSNINDDIMRGNYFTNIGYQGDIEIKREENSIFQIKKRKN